MRLCVNHGYHMVYPAKYFKTLSTIICDKAENAAFHKCFMCLINLIP